MWIENRWVGCLEYIIIFKNGTHHLIADEYPNRDDLEPKTVFTGSYEKCRQRLDDIEVDYLESQF